MQCSSMKGQDPVALVWEGLAQWGFAKRSWSCAGGAAAVLPTAVCPMPGDARGHAEPGSPELAVCAAWAQN